MEEAQASPVQTWPEKYNFHNIIYIYRRPPLGMEREGSGEEGETWNDGERVREEREREEERGREGDKERE